MPTIKKFDMTLHTNEEVADWLKRFADVELDMLAKALAHEQVDRVERRHAEARAEIEAALAKQGLSLDAIYGKKRGPAAGSIIAPKYRNPGNANETWTGRGKQPNWLAAIVKDMDTEARDKYLKSIEIK